MADYSNEIQHELTPNGGVFYIEVEGKREAILTYNKENTTLIMDHTGVQPTLKGTGAGKALVQFGKVYAEENGFKIIPLCPFVKAMFDRNPDWASLLA